MEHREEPNWLQELPPEASQRRKTFARFGRAMYYAQCVEKQLVALVAGTFNPGFLRASPEERDQFFVQEGKKTLGRLVAALREKVSVCPRRWMIVSVGLWICAIGLRMATSGNAPTTS